GRRAPAGARAVTRRACRAEAARRRLEARPLATGDRRLPRRATRTAGVAAGPRALARAGSRQRRDAGARSRRVRRLPRAVGRLRRSLRAESAAGLDRLDLPRATQRVLAGGLRGAA